MITEEHLLDLEKVTGVSIMVPSGTVKLEDMLEHMRNQQAECENYRRALEEIREGSYRKEEKPMDVISIHMLASKALGVPSKLQWTTATEASRKAGWKR